ncbi:unnamed protein product [Polarella glacialis]|nr:unnamed protein product [Polarella glacialis]
MCVWCLGPETGELDLQPFESDAESLKVPLPPGRLLLLRCDALSHRFSSIGSAYCLTCFLEAIPPLCKYEELPTPCCQALHALAEEKMQEYKASSLKEQRYLHMPRDLEIQMNRGRFTGEGAIAVCSASSRQAASHDALSWAMAFFPNADYAEEVPSLRWSYEAVYEDDPLVWQPGKTKCKHGAFVDGIELFDCVAFRIARHEASGMDPGHRLTLETGFEALVRDGYTARSLLNSRGGVYVANPPPQEWSMTEKDISGGGVCGGGGSIACGRFSYIHGLKGPCISVDVEGASSLVAVNFACSNLSRTGKWEPIPFAICSSWNLLLNPMSYIHGSASGILSPKGRVFAFDASASGYIRGESVVSIVLKTMTEIVDEQEVLRDGGPDALGQLVGSATNQSGRRSHLSAPDCVAMQEVIYEALRQADISPLDVDACECWAEAKVMDDALEATATARAFRPEGMVHMGAASPLSIVSAKSTVGNQLEAMGLSQILKVLLGASVGATHPTCHLRILSPHIDLDLCDRNASLAAEAVDFGLNSTFTGITNRSIAGTNCQAIIFGQVSEAICGLAEEDEAKDRQNRKILFWPPGGDRLDRKKS